MHKPVQYCEVMEIDRKLQLTNGFYDPFKEKEDDL